MSSFSGVSHAINCFGGKKKKKKVITDKLRNVRRVRQTWQNGRVGLGQSGHGSKWVILSELKTGSGQSGCGSGWVDPYFSHEIFYFLFFYKENNIYLPFGQLCNILLDVKCIILNSLLILRINSVKLINTYTIILKLYKS